MFKYCGEDIKIYPYVVFINKDKIILHNHILISEFCHIHGGRGIVIGEYNHIAPFCSVSGGGAFIMEGFSGLAAGARIITGTDLVDGSGLISPTVPKETRSVMRSFVKLEKHVFIGTNAIVHPGIIVGEGAVLGSGAVATKDIEPWTINVGVPARMVKRRDSTKIKELEKKVKLEDIDFLKYTNMLTETYSLPA